MENAAKKRKALEDALKKGVSKLFLIIDLSLQHVGNSHLELLQAEVV